jgi:2-(1,2-epoxy-1,2-dihydrophenyl)acetyl-CoA isomerase
MPDAFNTLICEHDGPIASITINRPQSRNAITEEMCAEMYAAVQRVSNSNARVLILRGAGNDFCVGADLKAGKQRDTPPTLEEMGSIHHAATLLHTMPQVTIAAIDGGCAGAGLGWAAACDFRFSSSRAKFSTGFLNVGLTTDMGLPWSLVRIVGGAHARELLFFPDKLDAARALEIGLVTRVFDHQELHDRVRDLAEQLCARPPFALRMMKANCVSADELSLREFIGIETARQLHCTNQPGLGEAMAANYAKSKAP